MGDGVYLVNCTKGGELRSALAFYNNIKFGGTGNVNEQSNDFQYVTFGSFHKWEGSRQSFTFSNSGVEFDFNIESDGHFKPLGTAVGSAGNSAGQTFRVFRDNDSFLFTNGDGFNCQKIYLCN